MHRRSLKNFLLGLAGAVVLTVAISLFTAATATPRLSYTVTDLGYSYISRSTFHAFIWRSGKMRDLNDFLPRNSGWELEYANGINNKGQIVGRGKHNGVSAAFLLTPAS